ncbi:hypothetical protein U8527_00950 [Kordia algicida OT-1]|uniref:Lipoprotein n=1 Tax=Kordia algicida OT-1 TaxID=391587 RepID=A9DRZ2_9FLAO|nr:hypothetical protein [Kordia algicida]EDP96863.1 hypothetical protein KAOT1_16908 [Kordia algicida OT-1]
MKKALVLVLGLFLIACGSDEKKKTEPKQNDKKTEEVKPEVTTPTYPKLTDVPPQLNYVFDNGYDFADDIKVDFISLESKGGDKYQLIYGLESDTDYAKVEDLKVSAVFYAKDPSKFKDAIYRKRKSRQVPAACKLFSLDDGVVVVQDFELLPKDFTQVKFYFYNDQGVINKKMLTVRNIKLPQ